MDPLINWYTAALGAVTCGLIFWCAWRASPARRGLLFVAACFALHGTYLAVARILWVR